MAAPKGNQYAKGLTKANSGIGRPAKYTPEWIDEEAKALREWVAKDSGFYLGSFAKQRGYHRQRFPKFIELSKDFEDAYREAQQWQEEKFLNNALTRTWDSGFAKYAMARVCGDEWKNSWDKEEEKSEKIPVVYSIDFSNCQLTPNGIQFHPKSKDDLCQNSKISQEKNSTDGQ